VTSNEIAAQWARRAGVVDGEVRRTVRQLGERLLTSSLKHMQEDIYDIPEDVSPTGRKKWTRTGALKAAEKLEFDADGAGCKLVNTQPYARARHELGRNGRATRRPAHWRDETREELRQVIPATFGAMNRRILEGR